MKRVLIAHQSTIPHYRVPFYTALERIPDRDWTFSVVFDPGEVERRRFFQEEVEPGTFPFRTLNVRTLSARLGSKRLSYQTFFRAAGRRDLVVVEDALNNLTYPLVHLHRWRGTRVVRWGHGIDRAAIRPGLAKRASEAFKHSMTRRADGFFAYTEGVAKRVAALGVSREKIFVLNNTIDIEAERRASRAVERSRSEIRAELGAGEAPVLLFVGRFTENKRIGFLLRSFEILRMSIPETRLWLVGSGGERHVDDGLPQGVTWLGVITDPDELAPLYAAADLYVFPGSVGLGPLQALCHDLPVAAIERGDHMPEFEYLGPENALILPEGTVEGAYAAAIAELLGDEQRLRRLRDSAWESIRHLTIRRMAENFAAGVDSVLGAS